MSTPWYQHTIEQAVAKQRVEHPNEFRILKGRDAKGVDMEVWLDKKGFCVKRKGTIYYFTGQEAADYLNAFEFSEETA
jgi:hypothetical protein